jgi:hypothetical protein
MGQWLKAIGGFTVEQIGQSYTMRPLFIGWSISRVVHPIFAA